MRSVEVSRSGRRKLQRFKYNSSAYARASSEEKSVYHIFFYLILAFLRCLTISIILSGSVSRRDFDFTSIDLSRWEIEWEMSNDLTAERG